MAKLIDCEIMANGIPRLLEHDDQLLYKLNCWNSYKTMFVGILINKLNYKLSVANA